MRRFVYFVNVLLVTAISFASCEKVETIKVSHREKFFGDYHVPILNSCDGISSIDFTISKSCICDSCVYINGIGRYSYTVLKSVISKNLIYFENEEFPVSIHTDNGFQFVYWEEYYGVGILDTSKNELTIYYTEEQKYPDTTIICKRYFTAIKQD